MQLSEHCRKIHEPIWAELKALRERAGKLPLWAWVLIIVLGPVALGLGGWALAQCNCLGERIKGVEVQQETSQTLLTEVRNDIKTLLTRRP